jgi:hypothetical protein
MLKVLTDKEMIYRERRVSTLKHAPSQHKHVEEPVLALQAAQDPKGASEDIRRFLILARSKAGSGDKAVLLTSPNRSRLYSNQDLGVITIYNPSL